MASSSVAPIIVASVDNEITGYVAADGRVAWKFKGGVVTNNGSTRILVTDQYVFLLGGGVACLKYLTGELVWQHENGPNDGSFILQNDCLFVGSRIGQILCYSASDGRLLWSTNDRGARAALGAPWNFAQCDRG